MKKFEIIWREILTRAVEERSASFSQGELAKRFGYSTSTVFHALGEPRAIGAIEVGKRAFQLTHFEKLLMLWATRRRLTSDISYQTSVGLPILEIEGLLPGNVIPTAYTAYRLRFAQTPADYDHVYLYHAKKEEVEKRFPPQKGRVNLTVLQPDPVLINMKEVPLPQLYVDLWNLPQWYARDFYLAVYHQMEQELSL